MKDMQVLGGQECPMCKAKELTLTEARQEIPYFGPCFIFSMSCKACNYHKADVESEETHPPVRYSLEADGEDDLKIRIVKSSEATIKIPHIITIEGGPEANGYVTNVEGILNRIKKIIENARDNSENAEEKKKAKNHLKKIQNALWGKCTIKIILEDKTGNSAIISEKAEKKRIK